MQSHLADGVSADRISLFLRRWFAYGNLVTNQCIHGDAVESVVRLGGGLWK